MIKKEITHPFRNITLEYDETKEETGYEKDLIKQFISLHDLLEETKNLCHRIIYFYKEVDEEIGKVEKEFQPLRKSVEYYEQQVKLFMGKEVKTKEEAAWVQQLSGKYYEITPGFHEMVTALYGRMKGMDDECDKYWALEDKYGNNMDTYRDSNHELYANYLNYSLDIVSLDGEEQAFYTMASEVSKKMELGRGPVTGHYDRLIKDVNNIYKAFETSKSLLSVFYDDQHLFDCSISDRCKENFDKDTCPVYLTPPGDAIIAKYRDALAQWSNSDNKNFNFNVGKDGVTKGQVQGVQEFIIALQHYPKLIEKTIFALNMVFRDEQHNEIPAERWKGVAEPMRWFAKMSSLPCMIFFFSDHDARAYILMGDLVADNKLIGEKIGKGQRVKIEGEMLNEVINRLFHACWFFMLYCHNTGFNPEPYIQALLADFDFPVTYDDVLKKFQETIKQGIMLQMQTISNDGQQIS
jgi:hypothetical protein